MRTKVIFDVDINMIKLEVTGKILPYLLIKYSFWTGKINKIRFDYFNECVAGDVFYIAAIELEK